jgi:hypothetical protein
MSEDRNRPDAAAVLVARHVNATKSAIAQSEHSAEGPF